MRKLASTCFLIVILYPVFSQEAASVANKLLLQYNGSIKDSNAVALLLRIDSIYLYELRDSEVILDSALLLAQQAKELSHAIGFTKGYNNAIFMIGNSYAEKEDMHSAVTVMQSTIGELKIRLLIMLGERYLFREGDLRVNQDSAFPFMNMARNLSVSINNQLLLYKSLGLLGKYYFATGKFNDGKESFMQVIRAYNKAANKSEEAHWWSELGRYMPDSESSFTDEINSHKHALQLYKEINNREKQPSVLGDIAFVYQIHNQLDSSIAYEIEAVELRRSLGQKELFTYYGDIAKMYLLKGNNQKALFYSLAAVNNAESLQMTAGNGYLYFQLGESYKALNEPENSIQWYKKSLERFSPVHRLFYSVAGRVVSDMLKLGKAKEALNFISDFVIRNKPLRLEDKETIAAAKANCFNALHRYDLAEQSYLEMIKLDMQQVEHTKSVGTITNGLEYTITGSEANYIIGLFYVEQKRFSTAMTYLVKALSFKTNFAPSLALQKDIHFNMFKVDSATGNYVSAIRHLSINKNINDSLFNEAKSKQIEELKIQYQTSEKEKDLKLLQAKEQVQVQELERSSRMRTFISILAILLMIMLGIGFSRYRLKQKNNLQLQSQKIEIDAQYAELAKLNKAQERVLIEKEWLVKEIHHRVKNNLQMIISLLNVQAEFLDHPSAINAIRESRERMQAVALIHQKLYQPGQESSLNMLAYIQELVTYFKSNLAETESINFKLDIQDINLDVSQAVPLGLMLNEAITNVMKYAFQPGEHGTLNIALCYLNKGEILLQVKDNGRGLPDDFDILKSNSLGIQLMQLLAEQLEGNIQFNNLNGLELLMTFRQFQPDKITPYLINTDVTDGKNINS